MKSFKPRVGRGFLAMIVWPMLLFPLAAAVQAPDAHISRGQQIYALAEEIILIASTVKETSPTTVYATRFASVIDRSLLDCTEILGAASLALASPNLNAAAKRGLTAVRNSLLKCQQRALPGPQQRNEAGSSNAPLPGINVGGGSDYKNLPELSRGYDTGSWA